ncbi:hypothetical protein FOA52_002571 [Chlamydomonas sp. UWO 241]|nr:hypothetical protein FOA52_002571 [Chlamydomonas sp. UWO 241]
MPYSVRRDSSSPGDEGPSCSCRVCLEEISANDLELGSAVRLGCACSDAGMHISCAAAWFGDVRKSTQCEVCGSEASGLPTDLTRSIRRLGLLSPPGTGPSSAPPSTRLLGFPSTASFFAHYCATCLLPALAVSMALSVFFVRVLGSGLLAGTCIAAVMASGTILHWVMVTRRPCVHLLFIVAMVGPAVSFAIAAHQWVTSLPVDARVVVGAAIGSVIGALAFDLVAMCATRLAHRRVTAAGAARAAPPPAVVLQLHTRRSAGEAGSAAESPAMATAGGGTPWPEVSAAAAASDWYEAGAPPAAGPLRSHVVVVPRGVELVVSVA